MSRRRSKAPPLSPEERTEALADYASGHSMEAIADRIRARRERELYFYVTVRDAEKVGWLLGPYLSREEAEADVWRGSKLAQRVNDRAIFYAFGVTRVTDPELARTIRPVFSEREARALGAPPDTRPYAEEIYVGEEEDDPRGAYQTALHIPGPRRRAVREAALRNRARAYRDASHPSRRPPRSRR